MEVRAYMGIFSDVNQILKERIAGVAGLELAGDRRSYVCPNCGNGSKHGKGDGLVWTEHGKAGRPNWWCPSCSGNWSNADLIATVEGINSSDYARLASRLAELFPEYATNDFSSFKEKRRPLAAGKRSLSANTPVRASEKNFPAAAPQNDSADDSKRNTYSEMKAVGTSPKVVACKSSEEVPEVKNYSRAYAFWRKNYSLKKYVGVRDGLWRGLDYEFLNSVGAIYNPEYFVGNGEKAPVIILPYDDTKYFWREVGGSRRGVSKGSRRDSFYVASPINKGEWVTFGDGKSFFVSMNIIFEGEIDALSLRQAFIRGNCNLEDVGILATGSANFAQAQVESLIAEYSEAKDKPKFLVLFDNDEAGYYGGHRLAADLRAAGFQAAYEYFGELGGKKIDANDILVRHGADALIDAVYDLIDAGRF